MTTIQMIGEYRDILFYGFVFGIMDLLWNIHNLIGRKRHGTNARTRATNTKSI